MSAKDDFFKKVRENADSDEERRSKVKSDINTYRSAIYDLTKQIEIWLHGSGVGVSTTENNFRDETILTLQGCEDLSAYQIHVCGIKNGEKVAIIAPEGIYGGRRTKGWASLIIKIPNQIPGTLKFILRFTDENNWTIKTGEDVASMYASVIDEEIPLTEESFFRAIQSLA